MHALQRVQIEIDRIFLDPRSLERASHPESFATLPEWMG